MALPLNPDWQKVETIWKSRLDPLLANPLNSVVILSGVNLNVGANTINHLLGRTQQGWFITDMYGAFADIYRSAPFNNKTLTLTSSAATTVSIGVF